MNLGIFAVIQAFSVGLMMLTCDKMGWDNWLANTFFAAMLLNFTYLVYVTEDWVASQRRNGKPGRDGIVMISFDQSIFPGGGGQGGK